MRMILYKIMIKSINKKIALPLLESVCGETLTSFFMEGIMISSWILSEDSRLVVWLFAWERLVAWLVGWFLVWLVGWLVAKREVLHGNMSPTLLLPVFLFASCRWIHCCVFIQMVYHKFIISYLKPFNLNKNLHHFKFVLIFYFY